MAIRELELTRARADLYMPGLTRGRLRNVVINYNWRAYLAYLALEFV